MASIWDFLNEDEQEITREELFIKPTPKTKPPIEIIEEEPPIKIVEEEPFVNEVEEPEEEIPESELRAPEEVPVLEGTQAEEDLARQFQEEETERGFKAFEEAELQAKEKPKTLDREVNAQIGKLNNDLQVLLHNRKFKEIQARKDRSIKSIEASARAILANKPLAGSNFGKMKLRNLYAMQQEVLNQANADMENLGGQSYQELDPDSKLIYTRLAASSQIPPQDRLQYVAGNKKIKEISQNILLNIPEDRRDQVDEYLFGKKKIENGQVQYDADNEPIRITKGIAFKNQFGVYEPSVNMDVFDSKIREIGSQFSPAKAGGEGGASEGEVSEVADFGNRLNMAKRYKSEYDFKLGQLEDDFIQAGNDKEDFNLKAAVENNVATQEEVDKLKQLKVKADEVLEYGATLDEGFREGMELEKAQTELNQKLLSLEKEPDKEELAKIGKEGKIPTFQVVDNKLVEYTPETAQIINDEYIIVTEPGVGPQLVKIGKGKLDEFRKQSEKFYYVDGNFTESAPSFFGSATRAAALGIMPIAPGVPAAMAIADIGRNAKPVPSRFNDFLKTARQTRLEFDKAQAQGKDKKNKKNIEEASWE